MIIFYSDSRDSDAFFFSERWRMWLLWHGVRVYWRSWRGGVYCRSPRKSRQIRTKSERYAENLLEWKNLLVCSTSKPYHILNIFAFNQEYFFSVLKNVLRFFIFFIFITENSKISQELLLFFSLQKKTGSQSRNRRKKTHWWVSFALWLIRQECICFQSMWRHLSVTIFFLL